MTQQKSSFLIRVITIWVHISAVNGFVYPPSATDVVFYSSISSTSTCNSSSSDVKCNTTCPGRTDFPEYERPLETKDRNCMNVTDIGSTNQIILGNGNVHFDEMTSECVEVNTSLSTASNNFFTLSFWAKVDCPSEW